MAIELSKTEVEGLEKGERDRFLWDAKVSGFGVKVTPAGRRVYILQYRLPGEGSSVSPRRFTIGAHGSDFTVKQARDEAIKLRGKIRGGYDPQEEKRARAHDTDSETKTVAAAAGLGPDDDGNEYGKLLEKGWLAESVGPKKKPWRPATKKEWRRIMETDVLPRWGKRSLASITAADVIALIDEIATRAPVHANRVHTRLASFFAWAVKRKLIPASPIAGVDKPTYETTRDRVLSDDEIRWFWKGCDAIGEPFGPLFKLLLLTLQRRDEVGTMELSEIDMDKKLWTLPREKVKNDRAHEVHLSEPAITILSAIKKARTSASEDIKKSALVFTTNDKTPISGFSRAKERLDSFMLAEARKAATEAGAEAPDAIYPWILHDLRRTAATGMARLNVPPHVVDKILNHVSGTISGLAAIYNRHAYTDERKAALDVWARYVTALLSPAENNVHQLRA